MPNYTETRILKKIRAAIVKNGFCGTEPKYSDLCLQQGMYVAQIWLRDLILDYVVQEPAKLAAALQQVQQQIPEVIENYQELSVDCKATLPAAIEAFQRSNFIRIWESYYRSYGICLTFKVEVPEDTPPDGKWPEVPAINPDPADIDKYTHLDPAGYLDELFAQGYQTLPLDGKICLIAKTCAVDKVYVLDHELLLRFFPSEYSGLYESAERIARAFEPHLQVQLAELPVDDPDAPEDAVDYHLIFGWDTQALAMVDEIFGYLLDDDYMEADNDEE